MAGRQAQDGNDNQTPAPEGSAGASLFEERSRTGRDKPGKPTASSKSGKLTASQLRDLEAKKEQEALLSYRRVTDLWARMLAGDEEADREWMHEAELLVESFRETRALFLSSRVSSHCWRRSVLICCRVSKWAFVACSLGGRDEVRMRRRLKMTWLLDCNWSSVCEISIAMLSVSLTRQIRS